MSKLAGRKPLVLLLLPHRAVGVPIGTPTLLLLPLLRVGSESTPSEKNVKTAVLTQAAGVAEERKKVDGP